MTWIVIRLLMVTGLARRVATPGPRLRASLRTSNNPPKAGHTEA